MRTIVLVLSLLLGAGPAMAQTGSLPAKPAAPKAAPSPDKSGADNAMQECMRLWDKATHMTRQEWARTCKRIQTRLDSLKVDAVDTSKDARRKGKGG
jgi:hypothetical protein